MFRKKVEIKSVEIDSSCLETMPCQHEVTVNYVDGTKKSELMFSFTIAESYLNYVDEKKGLSKQHFLSGLRAQQDMQAEFKSEQKRACVML